MRSCLSSSSWSLYFSFIFLCFPCKVSEWVSESAYCVHVGIKPGSSAWPANTCVTWPPNTIPMHYHYCKLMLKYGSCNHHSTNITLWNRATGLCSSISPDILACIQLQIYSFSVKILGTSPEYSYEVSWRNKERFVTSTKLQKVQIIKGISPKLSHKTRTLAHNSKPWVLGK